MRFLDLRANQLWSLPESVRRLHQLEKLDLRWNKFDIYPAWLEELQQRGCIIHI